jgi:pimeloyl-ACP methyl ester carboxylesterase
VSHGSRHGRNDGDEGGIKIQSNTDQPGGPVPAHPDEMFEVHERILAKYPADSRHIRVRSGRRVHVIESGNGPPVLHLHGSSTSSLSLLPLFEHLEEVRLVAVDRPGFGLSEPVHVPREHFRDAAIEFVDEVMDELGLETAALAGGSMGGTWALWYALARPERVRRLVVLTGTPLLPGTRPPTPLRVMATPVVGDLLTHFVKPNAKMVVQLMSSMGEKDTIVRYPALIESLVAAGNDPIASAADLTELRAILSPFGFRRSLRVRPDELRQLTVPTLLIWGDHDPIGGVNVAQETARLVPNVQLEVLPAGHVPYFGHPRRVSELLSRFVRSGTDG